MSASSKPSELIDEGGLRLRLAEPPGNQRLDGGWWPRSRDMTRELTELVGKFPTEYGRVTRALFSRPDWDTAPHLVDVGTRMLKVGSFPDDDTHLIVVSTYDGSRITLLVVPSKCTPAQGEAALAAASTAGNTRTASEVLIEVTLNGDAESLRRWSRSNDSPLDQGISNG